MSKNEDSDESPIIAQNRISEDVKVKCEDILAKDEEIRITASTDMDISGNYRDQWLVGTNRRILIFAKSEEGPELHRDIPYSSIKSLKLNSFYGNGMLQAQSENEIIDIVRFSKTYSKSFSDFYDSLENLINEEHSRLGLAWLDGDKKINKEKVTDDQDLISRCEKCGRALPAGVDVCPHCVNRRKLFGRIMSYLLPYKKIALVSFSLTLLVTGLQLVPPYLTKQLIDNAIGQTDFTVLWIIVGSILLIHAISSLSNGIRTYLMAWLGQKVIFDLRTQLYQHLQRLSISYYDKRQTGAIMSRITGDTNHLQHFIVQGFQEAIVQVLTLVLIGVILFIMDWQLALMALLPMPFVFMATKVFLKRIHKIYHRVWRRHASMNAVLGDTIPGIRVVKAFAQENQESERFAQKTAEVFLESVNAAKLWSTFFPAMGFVTSLGAIVIWGYGGYHVIADKINEVPLEAQRLTTGDLVAFITYMWMFYGPVQFLSRLSDAFQQATTASERVFEILDTTPEIIYSKDAVVLNDIKGEIEFNNVCFSYEGGDEVLNNIDVKIEAGQMIGLVGSSGSGKSTLSNLITRFYDATEGNVKIDGVDIRRIDLKTLRNQIGIVLQEPFLFHGSIWENIAYGNPQASRQDIITASKAANAHDFIMELPDGYDTEVGERGVGLSGGQKQRISIARAILKDPKILILDEATSAVDTETEKLIQEAIDRLIENRTTIAIAHRLSTLKNADILLVLEDGEIVERGTHEELLLKDNGVFKKLSGMQSQMSKMSAV